MDSHGNEKKPQRKLKSNSDYVPKQPWELSMPRSALCGRLMPPLSRQLGGLRNRPQLVPARSLNPGPTVTGSTDAPPIPREFDQGSVTELLQKYFNQEKENWKVEEPCCSVGNRGYRGPKSGQELGLFGLFSFSDRG